MVLTRQQEEQMIEKYNRRIWFVVNRFKHRMTHYWNNTEDLYQEAAVVFINHIRCCETEDEMGMLPMRDMVNAMCRYIMGEQLLSIPVRTTSFNKSTSQGATRETYEELDQDEKYFDDTLDSVLTQIVFDEFKASLDERQQKIIGLKMLGFTNREISRMLGLTDVIITRTLKKIRESYFENVA